MQFGAGFLTAASDCGTGSVPLPQKIILNCLVVVSGLGGQFSVHVQR